MKNLKFLLLLLLFSCINLQTSKMSENTEKAYFAGGCFWCMEPPFEVLNGVIEATSGYMGGDTENPTYEDVSMGNTGHAEVVEIEFDPNIITYSELLEVFWRNTKKKGEPLFSLPRITWQKLRDYVLQFL